jgi:hypothetical protein
MHDSLTPLGGGVAMFLIQLGEITPGGVGSGLYGMVVMALLAVFVAGLMVGRTPEYLGKKVEAREIKYAMLAVLILPRPSSASRPSRAVLPVALKGLANQGPAWPVGDPLRLHLGAGNNGSAFAGLTANTPWWNTTLGIAMLLGRFAYVVPVLAIAGSLAAKPKLSESAGAFPTHGALFVGLLDRHHPDPGRPAILPGARAGPDRGALPDAQTGHPADPDIIPLQPPPSRGAGSFSGPCWRAPPAMRLPQARPAQAHWQSGDLRHRSSPSWPPPQPFCAVIQHGDWAFALQIAIWLWPPCSSPTSPRPSPRAAARRAADSLRAARVTTKAKLLLRPSAASCAHAGSQARWSARSSWSRPATSSPPTARSSRASPASTRPPSPAKARPSSARAAATAAP